jgi:hypothetical protein
MMVSSFDIIGFTFVLLGSVMGHENTMIMLIFKLRPGGWLASRMESQCSALPVSIEDRSL